MRLKTPAFWYDQDTPARKLAAAALYPASLAYRAGYALHQISKAPQEPALPVLCVGNIVAGGSGKTPVALALMDMVRTEKIAATPCFLSRGYGGHLDGPAAVDPTRHSAADVGDEPLLLARHAPAFISRDRAAGAALAAAAGHDLAIMDDGLQNPGIRRTRSIVVIDGEKGLGNGLCLPAGPLREMPAAGMAKADAFVLLGDDKHDIIARLPAGKPVFRAKLAPPPDWRPERGASYIAFAGIAYPEKFRKTALDQGLAVAGFHAFPDHYAYGARDIEKLLSEAREKNARLLTTEKDAARLPPGFSGDVPVDILPVRAVWEEPGGVRSFLSAMPRKQQIKPTTSR